MRLLLFVPALAVASVPPAAQTPTTTCAKSGAPLIVRSLVGGTLGGWLGFVGAKIHYSDWNDASRGAAAHRGRNQAMIGGALIGAAIGSLVHVGGSCGQPAHDKRIGQEPITLEEITKSGKTGNVYDLVYSLRRHWLNPRRVAEIGDANTGTVSVYVDNTRVGFADELKYIPVTTVQVIRYYDAGQATFRFGARNPSGAIEVVTSVSK